MPDALRREIEALRRAGFGGVERPQASRIGWGLRLRGLTLPGGARTDALVLLPNNYPLAGPIGFYVQERAATGGLGLAHLLRGGVTLAEVAVLDPTPLLLETAHRLLLAGLLDLLLDPLIFKLLIAAHCLEWAWESDLIG